MQFKDEKNMKRQITIPVFYICEYTETGEKIQERWSATHDSPRFQGGEVLAVRMVRLPDGWKEGVDADDLPCIINEKGCETSLFEKDGVLYAQVAVCDKQESSHNPIYELEYAED